MHIGRTKQASNGQTQQLRVRASTLSKYASLSQLDKYEKELLAGWEEVYKKGHLTLWILLSLKHSPKHMTQIKRFLQAYTDGTLWADDKSIYRALRRYEKADMVGYRTKPSKGGPDLKVYHLTDIGRRVLDYFVRRNILSVYYNQHVKELLQ